MNFVKKKTTAMMRKHLLLALMTFCSAILFGQENLAVRRCANIDRLVPIVNIHIDVNNNKWVADGEGLFLAQSPDFASTVEVAKDQISLLALPDGNEELNIPRADLEAQMDGFFQQITCGYYNKRKDELWIGTNVAGVYRFKTQPKLELIDVIDRRSSKLRSDQITTISKVLNGPMLIGTDDGFLKIEGKKSDLIGKFFRIDRMVPHNESIWVLSDGEIFEVDINGDMLPIPIEERLVEGDIVDIELDSRGRIWIASEIVARLEILDESFDYELFGPAQEFTSQDVNCIAIDGDDALWVGTYDKGVYYIGESSSFTATLAVLKELSCDENVQDAILQVRASGGQPPYNYLWESDIKGDKRENLGPGNYAVTVSDQAGQSVELEARIEEARLTITIDQEKVADIGEADGHATVNVSGGSGRFTYQWDTGSERQTARDLAAGIHEVTVTDLKSNCSSVATIEILEASAPLTAELTLSNELSCPGASDAVVNAVVRGGEKPYQYKWSNNAVSEQLNGLAAGQYTITITDRQGSSITQQIEITDPTPISAQVKVIRPATTNQADGAALVQVNGGTGPYTFQWDSGESTEQAEKLANGQHQVTITDSKGCSVVATVPITEDVLPLEAEFEVVKSLDCNESADGALRLIVAGGKPPFQYQWSNQQNTAEATALGSGSYSATITDAAGTQVSASIELEAPDPITVSTSIRSTANTNQADGRATLDVKGGSGRYFYQWDNGEKEATAKQLKAGDHTVTITDDKGCEAIATVKMTEEILPLAVTLEPSASIACVGDQNITLKALVNGGKPPFTYQWTGAEGERDEISGVGAGQYSVLVTDAAGTVVTQQISLEDPDPISATITIRSSANTNQSDGRATINASGGNGKYTYRWDNGETDQTAKQLAAGEHQVTITDQSGCEEVASVTMTEDILPLSVTLEPNKSIACAGDQDVSLKANVSGGKPPFTYQWNNGTASEDQLDNLGMGTYIVSVTDAAGTIVEQRIQLDAPQPLATETSFIQPATTNNEDGKATIKVSGGTSPYQYLWDNQETTETAEKLAPGDHSVTITDANGCQITSAVSVDEKILPLAVSLIQTKEILCYDDRSGGLKVDISGGKPPFDLKWNYEILSGQEVNNLGVGTYTINVRDNAGNFVSESLKLDQPDSLAITLVRQTRTTYDYTKDGQAVIEVTGGTPPYRYAWDNGEDEAEAIELAVGKHEVTVTDANGCAITLALETEQKILPELTAGRLRQGQTLQVSNLYFEADSTDVTPESYKVLNEIVEFMNENPGIVIEVGGHTNNIPPHEFCDKLSTERAKSVAYYIVSNGVNTKRVVYRGYGKREPKYSNRTEDGLRRNQRVEIKILRIDGD